MLEGWEKAWNRWISTDTKNSMILLDSKAGINGKVGRRKIRTFEIYSSIDVTIDKVLLMDISENTATLKFLQTYKSDKNSQENGKQLVLEKKNGSWKITREVTIPKEELLL